MGAMIEPAFLRDMHRWAMQGFIDYLDETNESIENLSAHIDAVVKNHVTNDQAGRGAFRRVGDAVRAATPAQEV